MTKIFIINLESSTERKDNISRQLDELSLPFELFSAVDGRTSPPHPLLKRYNDDLSQTPSPNPSINDAPRSEALHN